MAATWYERGLRAMVLVQAAEQTHQRNRSLLPSRPLEESWLGTTGCDRESGLECLLLHCSSELANKQALSWNARVELVHEGQAYYRRSP
jgi:hypothetical protein